MNKILSDKKWKVFHLNDIFINYHGQRLIKKHRKKGNIPLLTASENNQGVSDFISNHIYIYMKTYNNFISIDMFGHAFYHNYTCYGDDNIYFFINNKISKFAKLFIVSCINKNSSKYSYGNQFRQDNADKDKILLPVNSKGEPDYEFMEEYIKEREIIFKQKYKKYIKKLTHLMDKEIKSEKKWKDFALTDIFTLQKGNQNNMSSLTIGNIPLVSAKKIDNGYKAFVAKNDKKIYPDNIITLNNDGDGGAGIAYYQPAKHLLDSHVTALIPKDKNLSKNILLYIATAITNQRKKFGHGYSINSNRLQIFRFMLPVNSKNEPDYDYMENYIKYLEQKKILDYLEYIKE